MQDVPLALLVEREERESLTFAGRREARALHSLFLSLARCDARSRPQSLVLHAVSRTRSMSRHRRWRLSLVTVLLADAPPVDLPELVDVLAAEERAQVLAVVPGRVPQGGVELRDEVRVREVAREEGEEEALRAARGRGQLGAGERTPREEDMDAPCARSLRPTCRPRPARRASAAGRARPRP